MENENKTLTKKIDLKSFIVPAKLDNTDENQKHGNSDFETNDLVYLVPRFFWIVYRAMVSHPTDYAVMNGCCMSNSEYGYLYKKSCMSWLRSAGDYDEVDVVDFNGKNCNVPVDLLEVTIRPALRLDLSAVILARRASKDNFKIRECEDIYHTIEFGEYPKTFVGAIKNKILEKLYSKDKLVKTSKTYTSGINSNGILTSNPEFEYKGKKYVRVISKRFDNGSRFGDGEGTPKTGTPLWVKVEPITWEIVNWNSLPKQINPQGNGSADTIEVWSENAITSGIPFYINDYSSNRSLWQNSIIRAYLNGYNLYQEIDGGNGNRKFKAQTNFDFTKNNFLTEAFSNENVLTQRKVKKTNVDMTKRRGHGVKIANKPLSIDEQINFYIQNGKSFMLHGYGKLRRIKEIDPDLVYIGLRNSILPEEVIGKTMNLGNREEKPKWFAPAWYRVLCEKCAREPNKKHVLFIDGITTVEPREQSLVYYLLYNNSIGPNVGKLPNNVVVVAAGNSMKENKSTYTELFFHSFDAHVYLESNFQRWLEWGSEPSEKAGRLKIHPLVSRYVAANRKKVFRLNYGDASCTLEPRVWEQISDVIYDNDGYVSMELVENKAGRDIAASLADFAKTSPITVEDVVEGNFEERKIPTSYDEKFALAASLRNANFEQIEKVRDFVDKYLGDEIRASFDRLWMGNDDGKATFLHRLNMKRTALYIRRTLNQIYKQQ